MVSSDESKVPLRTTKMGVFKCPGCKTMVFAEVTYGASLRSIGIGTDNNLSCRVDSTIDRFQVQHDCMEK